MGWAVAFRCHAIDYAAQFRRARWRGKPPLSAELLAFMQDNDIIPLTQLSNHRLRYLWGIYTHHTIDVVRVPLTLWKRLGTGCRRCDIITLRELPSGFDAIADALHLKVTHHPQVDPVLRYRVGRDSSRGKPNPKNYRITH